ncbi:MAG: type II toxin-antitoxin system RelE/ParE family toxin [Gammaproteobacteria bacterium]|nr:type II toxin-antitoxin system RelE/ParE family toxin [Gammaproteobacteria bacterium]
MIKAFAHKGLERFFRYGEKAGLSAEFLPRLERMLDRLNRVAEPRDMNLPGYAFHRLKGSRKDIYSVKIFGNWRLTFRFGAGHAYDVNLEDYH